MQEMTLTEIQEVGGGGTKIGTTGTGDGDLHVVCSTETTLLGGRIDPGGADAPPILI